MTNYEKLEAIHCAIQEALNGNLLELEQALVFVEQLREPYLKEKTINQDYKDGWRYIVWVGGNDDYYKNYKDAKRDADEWKAKGYDDVIIERIKKEK
jgi:hypothetical protein